MLGHHPLEELGKDVCGAGGRALEARGPGAAACAREGGGAAAAGERVGRRAVAKGDTAAAAAVPRGGAAARGAAARHLFSAPWSTSSMP
jgi:hypothetical protein